MTQQTAMQVQTTRWWLVRHAPVHNPEKLVYGRSDMPVDLSDERALRALSRHLPGGAVWVTSHLSRSLDTALKLLELKDEDIAPMRESGFAEQHFGAWERKHWNELPKGETTRFWTDFARQHPPNGESFADVVDRVAPPFHELTRYWAGRDIVAVIHGGTVRAVLANALGLSLDAALAFHIDTLGLSCLEYISGVAHPGWRVTAVNHRY